MKSLVCVVLILIALTCHKATNAQTKEDEDYEYEDSTDSTGTTIYASTPATVDDSEESKEPKLRRIYSLEPYCSGNPTTCSGFTYPDRRDVAFFEIKPHVSIDEITATYVLDQYQPYARYKSLAFVNSSFANFPLHLFYALGVEELDLRNCSVENVSWDSFLSADKLNILLLGDNRIEEIADNTFEKAYALQFLFLDSNRISKLHSSSFSGLEMLTYLSLANNLLEELPVGLFDTLELLKDLNLQGNRLNTIEGSTFLSCRYLSVLILSGNQLTQVHEYALRNQQQMVLTDVSDNPALDSLVLNVRCERLLADNCSLERVNIYGGVVHVSLNDNRIQELYFSEPQALQTLFLRNNNLQQIASLKHVTNLRLLDLSNNQKLMVLPDPWSLDSLERLDMSRTNLKFVPISSLAEQSRLHSLNISHNKIKEMNPKNFKYLENLTHFYIHGNNWNCFNLRAVMDMLIKPHRMSYTHDVYDPEFPGEYIDGIACMYRLNSNEDDEEEVKPRIDVDLNSGAQQMAGELLMAQEMQDSEAESLRKELKVIVNFYDDKFAQMSQRIQELSERLKKFEALNSDFWQHVTITT